VYAIAIIRYRRPLEEILKVVDEHRAYLGGLKERGILLVSGPFEPRHGGAVILRVPNEGASAALDAVRDGDPYIKAGIAQWEILPWMPGIGREGIEKP
jgi:uncharacterized protein YciI